MKSQSLGMMISSLRKANNMTQLELAGKMNVTDKAVSKWERDISCPDINSLPKLAEILGVTVDDLVKCKNHEYSSAKESISNIINLIIKIIPLAMGVAVTVLSILKEIEMYSAFTLLGIGLMCAGISLLNDKGEKD